MMNWLYTDDYDAEYVYNKRESRYIKKLIKIYGYKYDYSKVRINSTHSNIILICSHHGDFSSTQTCMLLGSGCPRCKQRVRFNNVLKFFLPETRNI